MSVHGFLCLFMLLLYVQAGLYVLFSLPDSKSKVLFLGLCAALILHLLFYFFTPLISHQDQIYRLDSLSAIGWITFPLITLELIYSISGQRIIFVRRLINFLLIPAVVIFLLRYWYDAASIKMFYQQRDIWYYRVAVDNYWFAAYLVFFISCIIFSFFVLLKWKQVSQSVREKFMINTLLISLFFFIVASVIFNLLYPFSGLTSLPAFSYFNTLPLGAGLFYCLVKLRQQPFSREIIASMVSDRIREFVFYLDQNARIYAANRFTLENLKYNTYELQRIRPGKLFSDYQQIERVIEQARETTSSPEFQMEIYTKSGTSIPVMLSIVKIEDRHNTFLGMVLIGVDYRQKIKLKEEAAERMRNEKTLSIIREELEVMVEKRTHELYEANERLKQEILERKRAEEQKKADLEEKIELVQEIHHRVKNNIQIIISLINMLSNHKAMTPVASDTLKDFAERVRKISNIHENFYSSPNLSRINFSRFIKNTTEEIYRSTHRRRNIIFRLNVSEEYLGIDQAIPCGIIFHELLANCLTHAFPSGEPGATLAAFFTISVEFYRRENEFTLIVSDNGVGIPNNFDIQHARSTGFQLVNVLVKQHLKGKIVMQSSFGTLFILKFSS